MGDILSLSGRAVVSNHSAARLEMTPITARYIPRALVEEYIAQGWRLSRKPLSGSHGLYSALVILEDAEMSEMLDRRTNPEYVVQANEGAGGAALPIPKCARLFVDVDGTLLLWPGDDPGTIPPPRSEHFGKLPVRNGPLIGAIRTWHAEAPIPRIVIWSANGRDHAEWAGQYAGLDGLAGVEYATKPQKGDIAIDDKPTWHNAFRRMSPGLGE